MKKRNVIAICALLIVTIVAGTFAYWNQTSTIDNPFDTGKYGTTLTEDFEPSEGEDWQPGVDVNKDTYVVNTGDQDLIVRIKLDEKWTYKGAEEAYKTNTAASYDVYNVYQESETDGLTENDKTVVEKKFSDSANWIDGGDGWFYYAVNLAGGETSDKWLDSVELIDNADMGAMQIKYYFTTDESVTDATVWYEYTGKMPSYADADGNPCEKDDAGAMKVRHNKTENSYVSDSVLGYSKSDYVLTVTTQTVQATQEALDAVFGNSSEFTAPTGTTWILK